MNIREKFNEKEIEKNYWNVFDKMEYELQIYKISENNFPLKTNLLKISR